MKTATQISATEAQKIYYKDQHWFERVIDHSRKVTFYQLLWAGVITWRTLYYWSATAVV